MIGFWRSPFVTPNEEALEYAECADLPDHPNIVQVLNRRVAFIFAVAVGFESVVVSGKSLRLSAQAEDAANLFEAQHALVVVTHQDVSRAGAGDQTLQSLAGVSRLAI